MRERENFREGYVNSHDKFEGGWTVVSRRRGAAGTRRSGINEHEARVQTNTSLWWKRKASTIFIDNIPLFYDRNLLKKLFKGMGRIIDVHLPWKKREKKNTRFGFVIFEREEEAMRVVRRMNGMSVFGHKLTLRKTFNGGMNNWSVKGDVSSSSKRANQQLRREGVTYAHMVGKTNQRWVEKKREEDSVFENKKASNPRKNHVEIKLEEMMEIQKVQSSLLANIEAMCLSLKTDLKFLKEKFEEICEDDSLGEDVSQKIKNDKQEVEGDNGSLMNEDDFSYVPDSMGEAVGFNQRTEGVGTKVFVEGVEEDITDDETMRVGGEDDRNEREVCGNGRNIREKKISQREETFR